MYLDAVIIIALVIAALCWFRTFAKTVYAFGIIDLFLRLLHYIANNIGIKGFDTWANSIFPESMPSIINKYTNGMLSNVLMWIYVVLMVFFLFYNIRTFLRKK